MSLSDTEPFFFAFLVTVAAYALGYWNGRARERHRVMHLGFGALRQRFSRTLGWVLNAVESGEPELMSESEFFDDPEDGPAFADTPADTPPSEATLPN